ncbi:MAG: YegP family protein [Lachnospiraceae bacterium]|nr:YegP family protein [Lachnospiraceae bacterium]
MAKFEVSTTKSGGMKFNLKAGNGQVIATSQTYKSKATCLKGVNSVAVNAPLASIEDQTVEGFTVEKNPKFEIYTDKTGEFRFRLKAKNGQIIATSEGYKAMKSCQNGVASVKKNAPEADIVILE